MTTMMTTEQSGLLAPLIGSLYRMAWMVEARDPYTGGHLWRVSQFSRLLAEDHGLPTSEVARITLGGFLHDLGKIGVPDAILNKPGRLEANEYAVIKTHPDIGTRLLAGHPLADLVRSAIGLHHETPDGRGYPNGFSGDAIPFDARIVGLTDAFDAMTSTRPYRQGMPVSKALAIVAEAAGTQFDAALAARLISMGNAGQLDHVVGHSDLGIPLQRCSNCGPTIVVRRQQQPGEYVYCRCCGGQARIERNEPGDISVCATGTHGAPAQLEPEIDENLVVELSTVAAMLIDRQAAVPT